MKKRSEKKKDAETLGSDLAKVSTVILTTFQGITVAQDTQLRRSVQAVGGQYKVVKNTLAERAGTGTPAESILKGLVGTNSIAYTETDPVSLAIAGFFVIAVSVAATAIPALRATRIEPAIALREERG